MQHFLACILHTDTQHADTAGCLLGSECVLSYFQTLRLQFILLFVFVRLLFKGDVYFIWKVCKYQHAGQVPVYVSTLL